MTDKTTVCKECGQSTPASQPECAHCGNPLAKRKTVPRPLVVGCAFVFVIVAAIAIWLGWTAIAFFHGSKPMAPAANLPVPATTLSQGSGLSYAVSDIVGGSQADRTKMDGTTLTVSGFVVSESGSMAALGDIAAAKPADCLNVKSEGTLPKVGSKVKAVGKYDAKLNTLTNANVVVASP